MIKSTITKMVLVELRQMGLMKQVLYLLNSTYAFCYHMVYKTLNSAMHYEE